MPTLKPPIGPSYAPTHAKTESKSSVDENIERILQLKNQHQQILQLSKQDIARANEQTKEKMGNFLAQQLRGQLPASLENALQKGHIQNKAMLDLVQRLANTTQNNVKQTYDPAFAREQASDPSLPQQALRWTKFVQKAQHVPGSHIQKRDGSASPKGSGASLIELLAQNAELPTQGAGLRNPKLVARPLDELSPQEKIVLMEAVFGEKMATKLKTLNIHDPLTFIKAGQHPESRTILAKHLKMPKARLLAYLMRSELLKIGRGQNGEMGIRPDHLKPLSQAGISMLGSLHALRAFNREDLSAIFKRFRQAMSLSPQLFKSGRPIVKRDFMHWARTASRQTSELYLWGQDNKVIDNKSHDSQELIQAWYLENLLWQELEDAKRQQRESLDYLKRERQNDERGDREDAQDEEDYEHDDDLPQLEEDALRNDQLNCFWITDHNTLSSKPGAIRRMYVCLDPETGAIIPQQIEIIDSPIFQEQGKPHE